MKQLTDVAAALILALCVTGVGTIAIAEDMVKAFKKRKA